MCWGIGNSKVCGAHIGLGPQGCGALWILRVVVYQELKERTYKGPSVYKDYYKVYSRGYIGEYD